MGDPRYGGRSAVIGLSAGFDAAQAAVVAGYGWTPIPLLPPASVPAVALLQPIIYAAYRAALPAEYAAYPETGNLHVLMNCLAKFVNGAYI